MIRNKKDTPQKERSDDGRFNENNRFGGLNKKHTLKEINELAKVYFLWIEKMRKKRKFFLLKEWCFEIGLPISKLSLYSKRSSVFREVHQWALAHQEHSITKGALERSLDSNFSRFSLACIYKWDPSPNNDEREEKLKSSLQDLSECLCDGVRGGRKKK